jgi:hypothetical protein
MSDAKKDANSGRRAREHYQINREIEEILKSRDTNLPKLNASRHNPFFDLQPVHDGSTAIAS